MGIVQELATRNSSRSERGDKRARLGGRANGGVTLVNQQEDSGPTIALKLISRAGEKTAGITYSGGSAFPSAILTERGAAHPFYAMRELD